MMDGLIFKYLTFTFFPLILFCFLRGVYALWWKPKRLEKYFKRIGIEGISYKETQTLMAPANSTLKPLDHAILQYVNPLHHHLVQKYGRISLCWFGRTPRLYVADAELVRQILLNKSGDFHKQPANPQAALLEPGITSLEGEKWYKRRKLLSPAFHHDKIMGTEEGFLISTRNLVERWKENISVNSQAGKLELDVAAELNYLTSDVIARAAFGTTFEEAKSIFDLQKQQIMLLLQAYQKPYFPGLRFLPTESNRTLYKLNNKIESILTDMILRKQRKIEDGKPDDDLLTLMLQCLKQNDMTVWDIVQECKFFYFAGQATTASWLTWTMIVLGMHPEWQEKARQEVLQVYGKRTPDVKSISQLKIVTMVLHEVMRLYPPLNILPRYTYKNTKLGDIVIPGGVEIYLPIVGLHHDPKYWGEDVDEFKPERFAQGASKAAKDDEMVFYPFGWGPRICLGQNFAALEAKLAISMILQHFSFELSPSYTHAPHTLLTLQPKHGAQLILHQI